jgi:hypothetical protein
VDICTSKQRSMYERDFHSALSVSHLTGITILILANSVVAYKDHITRECPREQTNCVNCDSDDHSSVDCPRVLKKSQKQVKKRQKSFAQVVAKSSPPEPKKTRQRKNSVSTPVNPPPNSEALLEALHKLLILLKSLKVIQYDEQTMPTMLAAIANVITPSFESAGKKSAVLDLQRLLS